MHAANKAIAMHDIGFSYDGETDVLSSFDLDLYSGRTYALLGFSGSGKTTLLKIVAGILVASAGHLFVSSELTFGYVPQESSLLPWLTIRKNVALGSELHRHTESWKEWRQQLVDLFALQRFLDLRPRALSGGMKQRAAVICALTSGANVLLLDEPFAGSDRLRKIAMYEALCEFKRRLPTGVIVLATHDPNDVFALGATAVWLDNMAGQPTVISPSNGEWDIVGREKLLQLMIRETA